MSYIGMLCYRTVGLRMSAKIRHEYLTALFRLPVSVLDTIPTGQTSNTITATANILQVGISEKLGTLIQYLSLMFAAVIVVSDLSTG
jgi:ATP-binding cassette subfamily B (MDR/TAP) protein 1